MHTMLIKRTGGLAVALAILLVAGVTTAQAQQMYRWVDQNGRVTYSQNPPPVGAAKSVQSRTFNSNAPENSSLPYAAQVAAKNFPVTLYTAPDCAAPCKDGRESLNKRGVPYREVMVGDEPSIAALKDLTGKTQVPVLQVGREALAGFNPVEWKSTLDLAGYPSSIPTALRPSTTVQRNLPPVKLYVTPLCGPPCQNAYDLLTARGITFQPIVVQDDEGLAEMKKATGSETVPVLMIGGSLTRGFDAALYQAALDTAGFPPAPTAAASSAAR